MGHKLSFRASDEVNEEEGEKVEEYAEEEDEKIQAEHAEKHTGEKATGNGHPWGHRPPQPCRGSVFGSVLGRPHAPAVPAGGDRARDPSPVPPCTS